MREEAATPARARRTRRGTRPDLEVGMPAVFRYRRTGKDVQRARDCSRVRVSGTIGITESEASAEQRGKVLRHCLRKLRNLFCLYEFPLAPRCCRRVQYARSTQRSSAYSPSRERKG